MGLGIVGIVGTLEYLTRRSRRTATVTLWRQSRRERARTANQLHGAYNAYYPYKSPGLFSPSNAGVLGTGKRSAPLYGRTVAYPRVHGSARDLSLRHLCLLQPEGHLHRAV